MTNQKVMGDSTVTVNGALELCDCWMQDPRVSLMPEPSGLDPLFREALLPFGTQSATKAIADCYLVGFAEAAGAHLVTLDRGLAATARNRRVGITLLRD